MKNKILIVSVTSIVLLGVFLFGRGESGVGNESLVFGFVTSTPASTSVGVASTAVLSLDPSKIYGRIENDSTQMVSCAVGATALLNSGMRISSSSVGKTLEFGSNHIPAAGTVNCIANTTTTVYTIISN